MRKLCAALAMLMLCAPVRADERWGPNLLSNGDLEQGETGWFTRMGAQKPDAEKRVMADLGVDDSTSHSEKHSIHFTADSNTTWWWGVESVPVPARPGVRYKVGGWIKTEGVKVEKGQYENCNIYIQFRDANDKVVNIDESPVRATQKVFGTHDWTYLERIVRAPEGAQKVVLGCTLTCTGQAWFDDLELHEATPFEWDTLETARFVYHYPAGTSPPSNQVMDLNERWLTQLEGIFGVKLDKPIEFYKYQSADQKGEMTGSAHLGHMEGSREIHSVLWEDRHDMVHVLMNQVAQSNLFLTEGLAAYWDGTLVGKDPRQAVKFNVERGALLPMEKMLHENLFARLPPRLGHEVAGSFVGYLIERFDLDMFMTLYKKVKPEMSSAEVRKKMKEVFGVEFSDLEALWKDWVLSYDGRSSP